MQNTSHITIFGAILAKKGAMVCQEVKVPWEQAVQLRPFDISL